MPLSPGHNRLKFRAKFADVLVSAPQPWQRDGILKRGIDRAIKIRVLQYVRNFSQTIRSI